MKKITFLMMMIVALLTNGKAQDVAGRILIPTTDTTVVIGSDDSTRFPLKIAIMNVGSLSLVAGDTIYYNLGIDGNYAPEKSLFIVLPSGMTLAAGQGVSFPVEELSLAFPAGTYSVCFKTEGTSKGVDPVPTNNEACINLTVIAASSVVENSKNQVLVYPNPAKDAFLVSTTERSGVVRVYDVFGHLVYENNITDVKTNISTESFANGAYFVTVETTKGKSTQKLMISK